MRALCKLQLLWRERRLERAVETAAESGGAPAFRLQQRLEAHRFMSKLSHHAFGRSHNSELELTPDALVYTDRKMSQRPIFLVQLLAVEEHPTKPCEWRIAARSDGKPRTYRFVAPTQDVRDVWVEGVADRWGALVATNSASLRVCPAEGAASARYVLRPVAEANRRMSADPERWLQQTPRGGLATPRY